MTAVCRIGDHCTGTCTTHSRTFTGTWTTNVGGASALTVDGLSVVRIGDKGVTDCTPNHEIVATGGTMTTTIGGLGIHRVNDGVTVTSGGTGVSTTGSGISDFG